jgi:hypothetical protein
VRAGTLDEVLAWRVCCGRGGAGLDGAERPPRDLWLLEMNERGVQA